MVRLRSLVVASLIPLARVGLLVWLVLTPAPALEAGPLVVDIPAHEGLLGHRRSPGRCRRGPEPGRLHRPQRRPGQCPAAQGRRVRGASRRLHHRRGGLARERPRAPAHVLHPEGATLSELARVLESARLAPAEEVLRAATRPGGAQDARRRGAEPRGLPLPGHLPVRSRHVRRGDAGPDGAAHAEPADGRATGPGQGSRARRPQAC